MKAPGWDSPGTQKKKPVASFAYTQKDAQNVHTQLLCKTIDLSNKTWWGKRVNLRNNQTRVWDLIIFHLFV